MDLQAQTKDEAIDELLQLLIDSEEVKDPVEFLRSIRERERLESTGIGSEIGIPHGITDAVRSAVCAMGISKRGIDFESLDGNPVHFVFLIGVPKSEAKEYLNLLAQICRLFKNEELRQEVTRSASVEKVLETMKEREVPIS